MIRRIHSFLAVASVAIVMLLSGLVFAQEPADAAAAAPADAAAAAEAPAADVPAEAAEVDAAAAAPAPSNDPGDIVANYFAEMSNIVAENMDNPNALIEKFSNYVKENEKNMRKASKAFEAKMASLKSSEAEVYRETVQRKITPSLNKLITLLIDFANRYPVEAGKLDSLLKVDAKYTYQQ